MATLIAERVDSETGSHQLGHSSPEITREHYISKPVIAADVAHVLEKLGSSEHERGNHFGSNTCVTFKKPRRSSRAAAQKLAIRGRRSPE